MLVNFSINLGYDRQDAEDKLNAYCALLISRLTKNGVTAEMFKQAIAKFIDKTSGSNYNKLPSVGDLLDVLGMKPKELEQIAQEKAQEAMQYVPQMRFRALVQYDCPISNWVIQNTFEGVAKFCWLFDSTNQSRPESVWVKKRFVEEYISAYHRGCGILHPIRNEKYEVEDYGNILQIGNMDVCEKNKQLAIEAKNKQQLNKPKEEITKLLNQYKE